VSSAAFQRLAALAEVLTVLVLGNLIGLGVYQLVVPTGVADGTAADAEAALWEGILIFLRLGSAAVIGLALLKLRRGLTPREAGLTRNGQPLGQLAATGIVLGMLTTLPIAVLFAVRSVAPFGAGLDAWWTYDERPVDTAFWIRLLGTSILIPPLVEEILFRGYLRVRLIEAYGVMGGVVLTALVFALSHTRYLAPDTMLLAFLLCIAFSSLAWTYLAQASGSIIPPLVAHAVGNGTAIWILFDVWTPLALTLGAVLLLRRPIAGRFVEFRDRWQADPDRWRFGYGLLALVVLFIPGLLLLPHLGRVITLAAIGSVLLIVTAANLVQERRARNRGSEWT
jgi:membrane protease YdiL (CAAX protease family)